MENTTPKKAADTAGSAENKSFTVSAPAITLPKGGGAIRGLGEKFSANPVTGTGSLSVPIFASPGRSGFGPQLSLSYDSGAGNGPFGFGWNLSLPSITRKTDKGLPKYRDVEESDVFVLSGAEDLVPCLKEHAPGDWQPEVVPPRTVDGKTYDIRRYRPRIEGLFARIERWTNRADRTDTFWRSISKDNITTWYGKTDESRIFDPEHHDHVFSWLICESHDDKGNVIAYRYKEEDSEDVKVSQAHERNRTVDTRKANQYLKRIRYGNHQPYFSNLVADQPWPAPPGDGHWYFEAVFDYGEHDPDAPAPQDGGKWLCRRDPFSSYRAGFEVRTYRLCQRVLMFHHFEHEDGVDLNYLVRSTDFVYRNLRDTPDDLKRGHPIASFIASVTQCGYVRRPEGGYLKRSFPPLEFEYSQAAINEQVRDLDAESLENLPIGLDGSVYQWVDLDGEGVSGVLTEQADAWYYKPNLGGGRLGPLDVVARKPSLAAIGSGGQQLLDLAGDGQLDLVALEGPTPGFFERSHDQDWEPFTPFDSLPNLAWRDPNLKFVDLTGDGHADVLITEHEAFTWHPSLAEEGYGPAEKVRQALDEEAGPRLVFADGTQSIYLADISGDGLTDLVRIRNGEVCYWPNLGYGRFGAKVTMDNAPRFDAPDQFDQIRIRLADIDGSGVTDIIYLGRDGVHCYFNESGNRWSDARELERFPRVDNVSAVQAVDLFGNGTACLVWSSPLPSDVRRPMRYIDLMGGQKPHLLIKTVNNLGAETQVRYAPSTQFYLKDKEDGKPWITKLPFPVHVVERVETYDHVSRNRFVTRYTYHHGYFDGVEREFRGFGMVEQRDTEEFEALAGNGNAPPATNIDKTSHVPPVLTKTWFHTGIYFGRNHVSDYFAGLLDGNDVGEYYREPGLSDTQAKQLLLEDTVLPDELTLDEEREACRALKGSMLRQEVYALDAPGDADYPHGHPYTVTEQNFTIKRLQATAGNRHGVFFAHPHEALSYHYERNPADPRVSHTMTLEVDDYGNVRRSLAIGYGRRPQQSPLQGDDEKKQKQVLVTYTENDVTNAIDKPVTDLAYDPDNYRTPLPYEARTYEITGFEPAANTVRFAFKDFAQNNYDALRALPSVPYESPTDYAIKRKRLIECVRTLYRKDDLSGLLGKESLQPKALPGESYKLAFTPGLVDQIYVRNGQKLIPNPSSVLQGAGDDKGGYVDLDSDNHWWIPSGRVFLSPGSNDSAATELAFARAHFFLPHKYRDPFHTNADPTETLITYDSYALLTQESRDALGNLVTAGERDKDPLQPLKKQGIDYRVLQPRLVMDPNRNRSEVVFDALGLVAGTAVMGKPEDNPSKGDQLDVTFKSDLTFAEIEAFLADPQGQAATSLGKATTRIVYDLERFRRTRHANSQDPDKWAPVFAATLARETHVSDPLPPPGLKIQVSFSYSDGFGREIQKKIQAEPGRVVEGGPAVDPRWVGSGWTIFNNKGKPIRQYEPFFDDTHDFKFGKEIGVSPVLFYDPVERVVCTLHPNHTYEKVVFDPWQETSFDVNDTVVPNGLETGDPRTDKDIGGYVEEYFKTQSNWETWYAQRITGAKGAHEQGAATKAAAHANTPTRSHFDSLGRPFLTIADNGAAGKYHTRLVLDIENNQREVIDARGRIVMRYDYYMAGPEQNADGSAPNRIHQASMDAGERWMLNDVAGNPIRSWDSRGHQFRTVYDRLRRPSERHVTGEDSDHPDQRLRNRTVMFEKIEYGESLPGQEAVSLNLRARVYRQFDGAGAVTNKGRNPNFNKDEAYDFKGNLLRSSRQLTTNYEEIPNWLQNPGLVLETFAGSIRYDALNRPIQQIAPHNPNANPLKVDVTQIAYNDANLLEKIHVWLKHTGEPQTSLDPATADHAVVKNINYDAKGQRELIQYGNGAETRYDYDRETFRLIHLYTRRGANDGQDCGSHPNRFLSPETPPANMPCGLQNLFYTYDPVGNITDIRDLAQPRVYFDNDCIEASNGYRYDAIYRLIAASGREHQGDNGPPGPDNFSRERHPIPDDCQAIRRYVEQYRYDEVGNIMEMIHHDGGTLTAPGPVIWRRRYQYSPNSNQLRSTSRPGEAAKPEYSDNPADFYLDVYAHDEHGNMTAMPHLNGMAWDFKDQLLESIKQVVNEVPPPNNVPETTFYVYDAAGERVRKVTKRQNGNRKEERIYLGGFEIYRKYNGNGQTKNLERESLHVMDDKRRVALIETKTLDTTNTVDEHNNDVVNQPVARYQLSNHLGSACVESDADAKVISYEEYYPYGGTAYHAKNKNIKAAAKRYRYSGKERDEQNGFYYYGARYYASWLGRWTTADPAGLADGPNLYCYSRGNPILWIDRKGTQSETFYSLLEYQIEENRLVIPPLEQLRQQLRPPVKSAKQLVGESGVFPSPRLIKSSIGTPHAVEKSLDKGVLQQERPPNALRLLDLSSLLRALRGRGTELPSSLPLALAKGELKSSTSGEALRSLGKAAGVGWKRFLEQRSDERKKATESLGQFLTVQNDPFGRADNPADIIDVGRDLSERDRLGLIGIAAAGVGFTFVIAPDVAASGVNLIPKLSLATPIAQLALSFSGSPGREKKEPTFGMTASITRTMGLERLSLRLEGSIGVELHRERLSKSELETYGFKTVLELKLP